MKKTIYLMLLILSLLFVTKVQAYTCSYESDDGKSYTSFNTLDVAVFNVTLDHTTYSSGGILNWGGSAFGINVIGRQYAGANKCPEYFIFAGGVLGAGYGGVTTINESYIASPETYQAIYNKVSEKFEAIGVVSVVILHLKESSSSSDLETLPTSCLNFNQSTCETNSYYSCIWNDEGYCNTDELHYIKCGDLHDIPEQAPKIFSFIINFLRILTPILLIIIGVISLLKALFSAKEDEIKKAQGGLVRKLIAAVMVFLVISIVQYVIVTVADSGEKDNLLKCFACFLNNDCGDSTYYKTASGSEFYCTTLNGNKTYECEEFYNNSNASSVSIEYFNG